MNPQEIAVIRRCLPDRMAFPYYPDRESAWTLAQALTGDMTVSAVKQTAAAKLLARPRIKPLVAQSGGVLRQRDVLAVAHADRAMEWSDLSRAAMVELDTIYGQNWLDFELTLDEWGTGKYWQDLQVSRKGGNLVLQLGFPSDHAELMGQYLTHRSRDCYEFYWHPIRRTGRPTLAWARLDIDMDTGTALIEEVQSDWLRSVREEIEDMTSHSPRDRNVAQTKAYEAGLRKRYDALWPRAMLLAALLLLREELGCRDIYMHMPKTGASLKHITSTLPPRSLYTALPKWFGFQPVHHVPHFLKRPRRRALSLLERGGGPVFWHLAL